MKTLLQAGIVAVAAAILTTGCNSTCPLRSQETIFPKEKLDIKPELFVSLDDTHSVIDALAIDPNNNLVLSVPNYLNYKKSGSKVITFDRSGNVINTFSDLPVHKDTGCVYPMGMEFGPDGNLYIADNQYFATPDHKSRVLRLNYKNGKPVSCDVVVEGIELANAIRWNGNRMYLSDTTVALKGKKNQSGIYCFTLDELNRGPVTVRRDGDRHLIITYTGEIQWGADGITFDKDGNLYCGLFGDGQVFKTSFNADGSVNKTVRIINDPAFECCDGIYADKEAGKIYLTNSAMNSVWVYDIAQQTMTRIWQNPDATGEKGLLDQPCEPIIWNDDLYVVNFDMTFPGMMNRENDSFNTISKFSLK